jgi:hypothetical protein
MFKEMQHDEGISLCYFRKNQDVVMWVTLFLGLNLLLVFLQLFKTLGWKGMI